MPIYEYICRKCERRFEMLVTTSGTAECPSCKGTDLEKLFSVFGVGKGSSPADAPPVGACGRCGDPRGPGSCAN